MASPGRSVERSPRSDNAAPGASRGRPPWTASEVLGLKPQLFIQLLIDSKLLRYVRDIDSLAMPTRSDPGQAAAPEP